MIKTDKKTNRQKKTGRQVERHQKHTKSQTERFVFRQNKTKCNKMGRNKMES